jgi:hypothetical protein
MHGNALVRLHFEGKKELTILKDWITLGEERSLSRLAGVEDFSESITSSINDLIFLLLMI